VQFQPPPWPAGHRRGYWPAGHGGDVATNRGQRLRI